MPHRVYQRKLTGFRGADLGKNPCVIWNQKGEPPPDDFLLQIFNGIYKMNIICDFVEQYPLIFIHKYAMFRTPF